MIAEFRGEQIRKIFLHFEFFAVFCSEIQVVMLKQARDSIVGSYDTLYMDVLLLW